jgi:hypothetical protein
MCPALSLLRVPCADAEIPRFMAMQIGEALRS